MFMMSVSMNVEIKGDIYTLTHKSPDKWGELRFNLIKEGMEEPYSLSVSSTRYKDSAIPGYGCSCKGYIYHRKCKHILELHKIIQRQAA